MDMMKKDDSEQKEPMFKCPSCDAMLKVETKEMDDSEDGMPKKMGMNAGNMPMNKLKNKISSPMGPTTPGSY